MSVQEVIVGFDIREARSGTAPDWDEARRGQYLLRLDVERPLSTDIMVWPRMLSEDVAKSSMEWKGWLGLWSNLPAMLDYLEHEACAAPETITRVAITLVLSTPEAAHPPATIPKNLDSRWLLLGYDVSDAFLLSGLTNCGYFPSESKSLRDAWGPRLNQHHLFSDRYDAIRFCRTTNERVTEHAPFFVYGLYELPKGYHLS